MEFNHNFIFQDCQSSGFKVFFTRHSSEHDADRDVTKGNEKWLYELINEQISNVIALEKYKETTIFSLFTKYYDLTQIPIEVNFKLKKVTLLTIISTLSRQRFERLSSMTSFKDSKGKLNIPIKC